ncbi:hypothetical protein [uncultured Parolsenella sp.]|uniref:hypothetical protein n=1 Tax=uncultured Parolsenella sp. TaxID=2083008 RepID=UPI0025F4E0E6|nr:hypothetical protein [uncultured Parolsenella sp.]
MATDSFKFWDSYMRALDRVDDATAGRLVKALCHEVFEGEPQRFDGEPLLGMVYDVMLGQAVQSRDLSRTARESGARGGRPKKGAKRVPKGSEKGAESEKKREEAKRNEASSLPNGNDRAGAGADAPPPLP